MAFDENSSASSYSLDDMNDKFALDVLPAILFLCLVMVVGSSGNVVVCFVYCGRKTSVTRTFILALAVVDLNNCVFNIPADVADIRYKYTFGSSKMCPASRFWIAFSSIASCSILVAIAIERYQKICKPFQKQTTPKTAMAAIVICCVSAVVFAIPAAVLNGNRDVTIRGLNGSDCGIKNEFKGKAFPKTFNAILFFLFCCASGTIIATYMLIWKRLRAQKALIKKASRGVICDTTERAHQLGNARTSDVSFGYTATTFAPETTTDPTARSTQEPDTGPHQMTQNSSASVDKTTLMMFLVSILFIVSFLPYIIITTISAVDRNVLRNLTGADLVSYTIATRFHFINSAFNPVAYSITSSGFRTYLKKRTKEWFA
ncbi:cholecystokinin receptor type A-like [Haliotis rubra]|uniref:cholecystokinin receptor type A-like n=1 Tax=Haliotis rubra TaxID=36100 RepID=UPI001EE51DC8|nr:cholecystokinin receptor type A-like [Haliotis rubra]